MLGFRLNKLGAAIRNFRVSDLFTGSTEGGYYDLNDINASPDGYHATNGQYELLNDGRGKVNLLTYSEEFDNAAWSKNNASVTSNAVTAPDGTTTGDSLAQTATTGYASQLYSSMAATTYTFVVYSKATASGDYLALLVQPTYANRVGARFDLNAGTVIGITAAGTSVAGTATITDVGSGWYRCAMTATLASASGAGRVYVGASDSTQNNTDPYNSATLRTIYVWGAQFEEGSSATAYQYTNDTTQGPGQPVGLELPGNRDGRGIVSRIKSTEYLGATYIGDSNWNVQTNVTLTQHQSDPDGGTKAVRVQRTSGASSAVLGQTYTGLNLTNYAGGMWIKVVSGSTGTVDLVIGDNVNQTVAADGTWQFLSATDESSSTTIRCYISLTGAGDIIVDIYHPVLKEGSTVTAADYQANGPYLGGPGEIWGQATSTARPTFAEIPKGGRRNQYASTDLSTFATSFITMSGTEMVEQTGTGQYYWISRTQTLKATTQYTASIKFKPSAKTWAYITVFDGTDGNRLWFDLDSGVVGSVVQIGAGLTSVSHAISVVDANGFYTCEVTFTTKSNTSITIFYHSSTGDAVQNYSGTNGVVALEAEEPQLEFGPSRTAFQTVTAAYQVTESGVPSILTKYLDGGDFQSLGRQYLTPRQDGRGVVNGLLFTENLSNTVWSKNATCTVTGSNTVNLPAVSDFIIQSWTTPIAVNDVFTGQIKLSGSGTVSIGLLRAGAGTSEETYAAQITLTATPTIYTVTHTFANAQTGVSLKLVRRFGTGDTATTVTATDAQINAGSSATTYQANSYTLGGSLGTCGFFCEPTQTWAVGGVFSTFAASNSSLFAKCGGTTGSRTLWVFYEASTTKIYVNARGTETACGDAGKNDGLWHSWLLVWDGATLKLYIDNESAVTVSVGTAAEEAENILSFVRSSSPAAYLTGMGDIKLMRDTYMNAAEIAQWRNTINTEYGVA